MSEWTPMDTYELHEALGAGGGGTVMKAYHKRLKKDVVIKKIHADIQDEDEKRIETDILKNLHHPYLPQIFDYFEIDGIGYTVMGYVKGESFGQKLAKGERFSEKKLLKYARQICEALDYLHSQELPVIHGDIKPDNIMLTQEDNICLIDFNISGITRNGHAVTFGYTQGYGAPEQYREFQRISALATSGKSNYTPNPATGNTLKPDQQGNAAGNTTKPDLRGNGAGSTMKLDRQADGMESTVKLDQSGYGAGGIVKADSPGDIVGREGVSELLLEGIPIDKRSDIYSLGAALYHIYSGRIFNRDEKNDIGGRISEGFLYILNKALQENPKDRYRDAGQMLAAVNHLYKHDGRYRNMKIRHAFTYVVLMGVLLYGVYLVLCGRDVYERERLEKYDYYMDALAEARTKVNDAEFSMIFEEATDFMPDRLEAYYQKALFLFEIGQYQDAVNFIRNTLDGDGSFYLQSGVGDMYYIMGNSYFELMNYESASDAFENAIKYNGEKPIYYVDQAISFARAGNVNAAKEVLKTAKDKGALSGNVYLVSGEIKLVEGDCQGAEDDFRMSVAEAGDDYTCMRAYVMCSKAILGQDGSLESVEKGIELLDEALGALLKEYHAMLLEQLVNVYAAGYEVTDDFRYAEGMLDTLKKIDAAGWATFTTYDNMVNIYYRLGDYAAEAQLLEELAQKYPDNYKVPMKQAFLEVALQAQKPQNDRDYSGFMVYYGLAQEDYSAVKRDGWSDPEMQVLENACQELMDGNWIESK